VRRPTLYSEYKMLCVVGVFRERGGDEAGASVDLSGVLCSVVPADSFVRGLSVKLPVLLSVDGCCIIFIALLFDLMKRHSIPFIFFLYTTRSCDLSDFLRCILTSFRKYYV